MSGNWYVQAADEVLGPLSDDELRELAVKKQITLFNLIRKGPTGDWVLGRQVRGLFRQARQRTPVTRLLSPKRTAG